jgi:enamine deaminase RidA (YjgF/YER057c/UK114 family)
MKKLLSAAFVLGVLSTVSAQNQNVGSNVRTPTAPMIVRQAKDDRSGTAWFVRAPDARLIFTGQVTASNVTLDTAGQAEDALNTLRDQLPEAGTDLNHLLRLNVYVANPELTPAIEQVIAKRFAGAPPAVTFAYTPLAKPNARVAFDAIAIHQAAFPETLRNVQFTRDGVAVMPAGGKVFVAGQSNQGPGLGNSVKAIMPNLFKALEHLGLGKESIVQVKAFIKPFSEHATALAEIKASFGNLPMPPVVLVEWTTTQPAEIELIASAPTLARPIDDAAAYVPPPTLARSIDDAADYVPLPGMTSSPVFSRIATVAAGAPLIFIGGLEGGDGGTAREQWQRIFDRLGAVLFDSGSSFRHMVKATYFLHDEKAREMLTAIRNVYYHPTRPPSASALDVAQMPRPGRKVMLDMIAVPTKTPPVP